MTFTYSYWGWKLLARMHLYRLFILFIIGSFFGCKSPSSLPSKYEMEPVLIYLSAIDQPDSIGFNLVESLNKLLYPRIKNGDIALWKTSSKKELINKIQFSELEKSSNKPFIKSNDLFIHEYWQLIGKEFDFMVRGFSFIGKSSNGEPVSFGFIDAVDVIGILKSVKIPTSNQGYSDISYWNAIHSKAFNFNIVQFGKKDFKINPESSVLLKNQACYSKSVKRNFYKPEKSKRITYKIISPSINSNVENKKIYTETENGINSNKQIILNINKKPFEPKDLIEYWKINTIRVIEKWSNYKNIPLQELEYLIIEVNGKDYKLSRHQIEELELSINLQGISEYLSEKNFDFIIEKINSETIPPQKSEEMYIKLIRNI